MELLQKYHQGIRSEIEARGAKFTDCADLGKALLTRKHRDSAEVRPRLFVPHRARITAFIRFNYFSLESLFFSAIMEQIGSHKWRENVLLS